MVRSIQVFKYEYPLGIGEITQILEKTKKIHYKKKNKLDATEQLPLFAEVSNIKKIQNSIFGYINYQYQHVFFKNTSKQRDMLLDSGYNFFISPYNKCMVVMGESKFRGSVMRLLSGALHRANENGDFKVITITKPKMLELIMKIKDFSLENDVERPNFEFIEKKYKGLDDMTYAQTGLCITKHKLFKEQYPIATYWSPKMKLRQCNGILNDPYDPKVSFSMGKFGTFFSTKEATPIQWYRFVTETCKSTEII